MTLQARLAAVQVEIHRHRYKCWSHMREIEYAFALLLEEIGERDSCRPHLTPATVKITAYLKGHIMSDETFPSGSTINLVATVDNTDGVAIPNAVSWAADQGTLTADPANPELATLVNVPDGDVTVTCTTTNGVTMTHTYTLGTPVDETPASVDFTATAA